MTGIGDESEKDNEMEGLRDRNRQLALNLRDSQEELEGADRKNNILTGKWGVWFVVRCTRRRLFNLFAQFEFNLLNLIKRRFKGQMLAQYLLSFDIIFLHFPTKMLYASFR